MSDVDVDQNPADNWSFETKQIHAGQSADAATNARALPIYQTTSYTFNDTTHAANLFGLAEPGNIYTRLMNPTQDVVEQRLAALEGGVAALLVASGQAAETYSILNIVENGGHVVSSPRLYGGTYNLFHYTLPKLGIEVTFVENPDDLESWRAAAQPNTKAFYGETFGNPVADVLDIPAIAEVAHKHGIPLVVDNTFASPYLQQPLVLGADVVLHSSTKYLGGHSDVVGGLLVTDDEQIDADVAFLQNGSGGVPGPFDAYLTMRGIKTLGVRMDRHCDNAEAVVDLLSTRSEITSILYPGLPEHPGHEVAARQMSRFGGMISVRMAGGREAAQQLCARTEIFTLAESLGGIESLIEHPGAMTHASTAGSMLEVPDDLVRLSVGIEDVADLLADLEQALDGIG